LAVRVLAFIFCALTMCWATAAPAEKRVALVIGNSNYTLAPLDNPKNDADDVAAALKRLQFDVTERKDLTVREFDQAVDAFEAAARNADVALFFFSGHGVQIDKRGFIAPVDLKAESESSALRELVAIQEVVSRIENAARVSVIVLDACRDSPLQERLRRISVEKNKAAIPPKGLPPVSVVGSNTLIVYATVPGETASDGPGQRNSPFTASLLKNIETPGLEIELMFKRVTAEVLNATRGKQHPERLSRLQDELLLSPASGGAKAQSPDEVAKLKEQLARLEEALKARETKPSEEAALRERLERLEADLQKKQQAQPEAPKPGKPQVAVVAPPPPPSPCDGLLVSVAQSGARPCIVPGSGESFKDCANCPEMAIAPSGSFMMGSPKDEPEHQKEEEPQHKVTIAKPFAVGKFAVTFAEWDACADDGGCGGNKPSDSGWGRGDRPVINVNWNEAKDYIDWLSKKTGKEYRLLSEAEREYATRAGTATPFWWGRSITPALANYHGSAEPYKGGGSKGEYRQKTLPVKSFKANPWGLYQVHGNIWEWVEDCWNENYNGAPSDGSARTTGDCSRRLLRGGSWGIVPQCLRAALRFWFYPDDRYFNIGFRLARTL
jgi:formylglycine-generating enzyme required for sulfatase activity